MRFALLFVGACSVLFQNKPPKDYDGKAAPQCSTTKGFAALDGMLSIFHLAGAGFVSVNGAPHADLFIAGGVLEGIVLVASSLAGDHWANECRLARDHWKSNQQEERIRQGSSEPP